MSLFGEFRINIQIVPSSEKSTKLNENTVSFVCSPRTKDVIVDLKYSEIFVRESMSCIKHDYFIMDLDGKEWKVCPKKYLFNPNAKAYIPAKIVIA